MEPDRGLIKQCVRKDRKAQALLYKLSYGFLMQICFRYASDRDDAKALLNQGFLKICNHIEKALEVESYKSWASRIMINTAIDQYRKDRRRREKESTVDFQEKPMEHPVNYNEAQQFFDAEHLRALIKKLPPLSQKIFNLAVIDGYGYEEIAAMLNTNESTCRWHVYNSRAILQKAIAETMKKVETP